MLWFDSDTMLLTDNIHLLNAAKKNYNQFPVNTNSVKASKIERYYNTQQKTDLDVQTSENLIGEIVNLSQILNSLLWDSINNGSTLAEKEKLYFDICQLNALSGCEIDKAKKELPIDSAKELATIRSRHMIKEDGKNVKPQFFKHILLNKDLLNTERDSFVIYDTTMDYVSEHISKQIRKKNGRFNRTKNPIPIMQILDADDFSFSKANRRQYSRLIGILINYNAAINNTISNSSLTTSEMGKQLSLLKESTLLTLNSVHLNDNTIIYILHRLSSKKYANLYKRCFSLLFCQRDSVYMKVMKVSESPVEVIDFDENGDIELFGYKFAKYKFDRKIYQNSI